MKTEADRRIDLGTANPYHGKAPKDWAESAALGICHDLCDRSGIKHQMRAANDSDEEKETSTEIVETMAAIIRAAHNSNASTSGDGKS